jgi:mRNA interferase MazF
MTYDDTGLNFGDIVLIPFPFTNQSAAKRRPAVVISAAHYNVVRPDVILMAVTSQLHAGDFEIGIANWEAAGLVKPSAVKPIVATIEQSLVIRRLGCLTPEDCQALRLRLLNIIALEIGS